MTKIGHNSGFDDRQLLSIVERIERLEEEKTALGDDIKEVYAEAKGSGYDTAILRQAIRLRRIPTADRMEREAILDLYMTALERNEKHRLEQSLEDAE